MDKMIKSLFACQPEELEAVVSAFLECAEVDNKLVRNAGISVPFGSVKKLDPIPISDNAFCILDDDDDE